MKRRLIFSVLIAVLLFVSSTSVYAMNKLDDGDVGDRGQCIVIRDANGVVVETCELGRQIYVNGTQFTIPAGGTLTSQSYYADLNFSAGFYFVHSSYSGYATTRNRSVTITIRRGTAVHGTRQYMTPHTFSTNIEDNYNNIYYFPGTIQPGCAGISVEETPSGNYHYYEAVYKNNSSSSMVISLLISRD